MKTVTDKFEPYIGTKEYNGIVRTMLEWYYGTFKKNAWCAISMSYMLNELGLLSAIGKKQSNCYELMKEMESASKKGIGKFYYKDQIPKKYKVRRGTVIFMLKDDPPMTHDSSKHVTSAYEDFIYENKGYFMSLGGNQSDYIKTSQYTQKTIYAIYEPAYETEPVVRDLKKGCKGEDVKELQRNLNKLGYRDQYGLPLSIDGSFGGKTDASVKNLQKANKLKVDGVVGSHTRAKINELLNESIIGRTVRPRTDLNLRTGPSKSYPVKKVLHPTSAYDDVVDGISDNTAWVHLKKFDGWVSKKYLEIVK